ncbi:TonB-dependent receptor domain-containing protein [Flavobacterium sinopsychrotolerans]|uniref:Outer membrane receptor proteins, mostly Fe transport n=1 Tax=Flavobacterium sinopsychrotolerans TaxID=604089 RepID=A0A1H8PZX4_9FLAO|nr:TonB-dependent receptor [Flavobacterium sinopsychrotolerans]SEO47539.1 Outer membrane receptor proteins, mostly Fe transport [Flavobacterium sinopsychrotolerans]
MRMYLLFMTLFFCGISFAQNTISGSVTDRNNQPVPGANIKIVGESSGTTTDFDGSFTLQSSRKPPYVIEVTSVGFESQKVSVSSSTQKVLVQLEGEETKLNEIVVSASRTPERVLESPVTIERMGIVEIKKTASPSFYDGLENMKEVQMNTSSMSFKSINTRGFATVANTRFMQLVDGMDNSSPLLNFVLGNLIGVSEIDVQSVELLPGASSALYGANAFNGILFMTSKSPFTSQGIRAYAKFGQTTQKAAGTNDYLDYGVRMAKAFNKYIAGKANFAYMRGTEWHAVNYDDKTVAGRDRTHYGYDGINVYGDEVSTVIPAPTLPSDKVSRTGYNEVDLTDNKVSNTKIDLSLHVRPFGDERLEVIWQSKFGYGNTVYQGANRYYLNNFFMQQHKIEFKGKNFFLRGYTTTEDGGQSYDMLFTGININRKWKSDQQWFTEYGTTFAQSTLGGMLPADAHRAARARADQGRFLPGTPEFRNAFNQVTNEASVLTGSKLVDNSRIYHSDVNYNFKDLIKFAEIQVGGSYRQYELNSFGRIYTDANGPIKYDEYGAYTQVMKKMIDDRLKFTGSIRYDKAQNFDGNISPRVSLVYSGGQNKNHNFRGSFQTGFRNPTTQDQYIGFNVGSAILLGSAPDNLTRFVETLPINGAVGQAFAGGSTVTINGLNAYDNSYTASSVASFAAAANPALLRKTNAGLVKPEEVKAIELGYRSFINRTSIDINGYYNIYNNFIGNLNVVAPLYGTATDEGGLATAGGQQSVHALQNGNTRVFQLYTNTPLEIESIGFGIGLSRKVYKEFEIGANYNYAEFKFDQSKDPSFEAGFNTPKHRIKASFGNEKLFPNFGFNVSGRWNSEYLWQSSFADGTIEAATVIDAQLNYNFPSLKSTLKIGASNIGGKEYGQVLGAGLIGQQYFASWTINP